MKQYQYQIVRYLHDQVTGEFVNVGVVLFEPSTQTLLSRFINRFSRISGFFSEVNGHYLLSTLKQFEKKISDTATNPPSLEDSGASDMSLITYQILPNDDSALQLSEVKKGIDISPDAALDDLFDRLCDRYNIEKADKHTDSHTWRRVYKRYFDEFGITSKLTEHSVKTSNDQIQFNHAWKNGVWNCYQSLALDLKKEEAIKNKVYKWSGILKGLESSNETLKLYFLTSAPTAEHKDIQSFVDGMLATTSNHLKVEIVSEDRAKEFAAKVRMQMEKSNIIEK
jgi:hypothetical protein